MIKGKMLRDAIISGANHIANQRQNVDALNVFPVPDGDTGTNMSMTIGAAKRELERLPDDVTVGEVSQTAASALLRGARGNSGVILSLLFRGFSKGLAGKKTAAAGDLANALALGVDAAYKAVMKPTEGTILTVSRMAAAAAKEAAAELGDDVKSVWAIMIAAATDALEKTPDMLPVLKKAGVVDAGGKGFLVVLEGMGTVINGGGIIAAAGAAQPEVAAPVVMSASFEELEGEITFGYCTEFIIDKTDKAASALSLRAYLESIGDSVVVVDDEEIIKAHVHTEDPGKALQNALQIGPLSKIKIENMREQFERECAERGIEIKPSKPAATPAEPFPYAAVDPDFEYGFVAIAAGDGISALFHDLGANNVVSGGQTMNPSTDDILKAVHATPAKTVFVLPNNKNIIMAAEQAVKLADRKVMVLHTKTIPQGLTAMMTFDNGISSDDNYINMTKAFEQVSTGQVTFAARDSDFDGHKIKQGEILALDNGKLSFTDTDKIKAAGKLAKTMVKKKNNEQAFITLIYGEGATQEDAEAVEAIVKEKYPDVEFALVSGDQPVYYFIISIE